MRQLEGGWLSNSRSSVRRSACSACPMSESGIRDQAGRRQPGPRRYDYNIKEGLPGQFGGGIGYSESQKFSLNGNFVHSISWARRSRRAGCQRGSTTRFTSSRTRSLYDDRRGITHSSLSYRDSSQFVSASSQLSNEQISAAMRWPYPITEYQGPAGRRVGKRIKCCSPPRATALRSRSTG